MNQLPIIESATPGAALASRDAESKGTYAFVSLGCPKNLVDSEKMLGTLALDGYTLVSSPQGADFVITQLFFDNADFFHFRDHLSKALGSSVTLIPGILPILSGSQLKKFTLLCGARIPERMLQKLSELGDDDQAVTAYGVDYATEQCRELLESGATGLHFYCLNKAASTVEVVQRLKLR